jgi:uncharacterized protein (TIGR03437 family)
MSRIRSGAALAAVGLFLPVAAFAQLSGNATLSVGNGLSLDTGNVSTSGAGDIVFTGSSLTYVGTAKGGVIPGITGQTGFAEISQTILTELAALATTAPISAGSLTAGSSAGSIIGLATNGGNASKLLVTALSATSITFQYTTYGASAAPSGPTITGVLNNYSYIPAGLPNSGIAQGALFVITGTGMASIPASSVTLQNPALGIPLTLNGASITVTVNGVVTNPGIYYAGATQIAAVLPSNTPAGTGTIVVNYNSASSAPATIIVVAAELGLDTYYGSGSGLGVATNPSTGAAYNYTNSIVPGSTVVLWGSGLGSTGDSDLINVSNPHSSTIQPTFYIGGVAVAPGSPGYYAGRSVYPGVNQINLTIPATVSTGCAISVVAVSGTTVSSTVTLPISATGGVCTDPVLGYNGTQLGSSGTQTGNYNFGTLGIVQTTTPAVGTSGGLATDADAIFETVQYSGATTSSGVLSLGSCIVSAVNTTTIGTGTIPTIVGLDAGTITIQGPTGTQSLTNETIPTQTGPSGEYFAQLANSFLPATGGTFTFTGLGGKNVGPFTASIAYTNPLTWTNMSAIKTITRASGQSITWTGGGSNSYVFINGSSSSSNATASFTCYAPASAGQLTFPSYVLLALPSGTNGSLLVENAVVSTFTASGLTIGSVIAGVSFDISAAYQ